MTNSLVDWMVVLKPGISFAFIITGIGCYYENWSIEAAYVLIGIGIAVFISTFFSCTIGLIQIVSFSKYARYARPNMGYVVAGLSIQLLVFICLFIIGNIKSDQLIGLACSAAAITFYVTYVLSLIELGSIIPKEEKPKIVFQSDIV